MYCENCGSELKANDKFCTYCGAEVPPLPSEYKGKFSKLFMFLSIFVPVFGFFYGIINYLSNNGKPWKPYILAASISYIVMWIVSIAVDLIFMNIIAYAVMGEDSLVGKIMVTIFVKFIDFLEICLEKYVEFFE